MLKIEPDETALLSVAPTSPISPLNTLQSMTRNTLASASCSTEPITIGAGDSGKFATVNGLNDGTCLPALDVNAPFFGEIFDELILQDGYCALLAEDIESQSNKMNIIDSFINYRDDSDDKDISPSILSPDQLSKVKIRSWRIAFLWEGRGFLRVYYEGILIKTLFFRYVRGEIVRVYRVRREAAAYRHYVAPIR